MVLFINLILVIICLGLFSLWLLSIISLFLMVRHRKTGVRLFDSRLLFNPFNLSLLGTKYLTQEGIYWRNRFWICFTIFTLVILFILFIAVLLGIA